MQETKCKAGIGVRYLGEVFFLGLGVLFLIWGLVQFPITSGGVAMILMAIGLFFVASALLLFGYNRYN